MLDYFPACLSKKEIIQMPSDNTHQAINANHGGGNTNGG